MKKLSVNTGEVSLADTELYAITAKYESRTDDYANLVRKLVCELQAERLNNSSLRQQLQCLTDLSLAKKQRLLALCAELEQL